MFLGAFNDNVFKNGLVILITYRSVQILGLSTDQIVALCGGIFILPFLLFSALAGQICEKYPKHELFRKIKLWEIIVMTVGALGFLLNNIYILLLSLFLMGLQSTFFGPVKFSILPDLLTNDELVEGNALFEMGTFVAILMGTILGGILISLGDHATYLLSGATLIFALMGYLCARKMPVLNADNSNFKISFGIIRPTWDVLQVTKKTKNLLPAVLGISWFWFLGAAMLSLFPPYVKNTLQANEYVATLFLGMFSIGVATGSMVYHKISGGKLEPGFIPIGCLGMSLFILDLFFIGLPYTLIDRQQLLSLKEFLSNNWQVYRILFDLFMFSFFAGIFIVPLYTFIQKKAPVGTCARVFGANNILNAIFMVLAALSLIIMHALQVSIPQIFLILGLLNLCVSIISYYIIPEFYWSLLCKIMSKIFFNFKFSGKDNIPTNGAALLICNHLSFIDWLFIAATADRPIRFVMHYEFMKIPILKRFFTGSKVIPIASPREDMQLLKKAFLDISQELENGHLVCFFPEGEITQTGEMGTFKKGLERIIRNNPVPVIPMALTGLWGSFFSRKYGKAMAHYPALKSLLKTKVFLKIGSACEPPFTAINLEKKVQQLLALLKK